MPEANPADLIDHTMDTGGQAAEVAATPIQKESDTMLAPVGDNPLVQDAFATGVMAILGGGAAGAAGAAGGEAAGGEAGFAGESSAGAGTTASGASSTTGSFSAGAGGPSGLDAAGDAPMGPPPMPAAHTPTPEEMGALPDAVPVVAPTDAAATTDPTAPAPTPTDGTSPVDPTATPTPPPVLADIPVADSATTGGEMFSGGGGSGGGFGGGAAQGPGVDGEAGFAGEGSPSMGDPAGSAGSGSVLDNIDTAKLEKALGAATRYGPLGMGLVGMFQQKQAQKKAADAAKRAGAPDSLAGVGDTQRQVGKDLVGQAQSGNINASDKTNIDNWESNAIAQSRAYYAKAGLSDSSMATNAEADIKSRATAMREQARQNLLQQGLDALNVTDKFTADAIKAQMAGDQQAAKQATDFLNSYGQWLRMLPQLTGQATK